MRDTVLQGKELGVRVSLGSHALLLISCATIGQMLDLSCKLRVSIVLQQ